MSRKGENIYKRKDGRWEARYIKGYTTSGQIHYGYCYGKTYSVAKDKLNRAKLTVLLTPQTGATQLKRRFSDFCDEWLLLRRSKVRASTYEKYQIIIERHIKPQLGNYFVSALSTVLIEQFSYSLLHKHGLSVKTVRDILTVLSGILKYLTKIQPYMQHIEIVYPKEEPKEIRVLSRGEQQRLVAYLMAEDDLCKFGTLLALLTGLRIGELCALKWKHISLYDRTLRVECSMQRLKNSENDKRKTKIVISDPKTFSSVRSIPLGTLAYSLCSKHFVNDPEAFVLTGNREFFIAPRTLQYRMKRYTKDCALDGVHFHTLRHSFATRCVEVGFEIKSLSEVLGHSSPKITLERYVHSSMELKRENMEKLACLGY